MNERSLDQDHKSFVTMNILLLFKSIHLSEYFQSFCSSSSMTLYIEMNSDLVLFS